MDYAAALDRLMKPRFKGSKKLGHKLELYLSLPTGTTDPTDTRRINLKYFSTDILTWYDDGGVIIRDGGWLHSPRTREKINEYSPRGWRLTPVDMRFTRIQKVAVLEKRTEKWERVWAQPFASGVRFYDATGRQYPHGDPFQSVDAFDYIAAAKETTKVTVDAYLAGKLTPPLYASEESLETTYKSYLGQRENEVRWTERIRDIGFAKQPDAALVAFIIDRRLSQSIYADEARKYWADIYPLNGHVKTQKQQVKQLEHFMRLGHQDFRAKKNDKMFFETRTYLYEATERFLLEEVGFEFFSRG